MGVQSPDRTRPTRNHFTLLIPTTLPDSPHVHDPAMSSLSSYSSDSEPIEDRPSLVLKQRSDTLIGKTITGTVIQTGVRHFIRWNRKKSDTVYITKDVLTDSLGPDPATWKGSRVQCRIEGLGPSHIHPWKQHPVSREISFVRAQRPRAKKSAGAWRRNPQPGKYAQIRAWEANQTRKFGADGSVKVI